VRGQREAVDVGLVHLDVEADLAAGEPPAHPRGAALGEPRPVEVLDVEVDRRPSQQRVGVGQDVEDRLGAGGRGGGGGVGAHRAGRSAAVRGACRPWRGGDRVGPGIREVWKPAPLE
jgi:hypothetical protein